MRAIALGHDQDKIPIAVTTSDDRTAIVWDLRTGERRYTLTGHTNSVNAVALGHDQDKIPIAVTTSNDETAIVWDLAIGRSRHTLPLTDSAGPVAVASEFMVIGFGNDIAAYEVSRL